MSKSSQARIDQSRRARRAAERRAAPVTGASSKGRSPVLLITAIVGGIGVVLLGALILASQSGSAVADTSNLVTPAVPDPGHARRWPGARQGRCPGHARGLDRLPVSCLRRYARTVEPALVSRYVTPGTLRIVHHDAAFQGAKSSSPYDESVQAAAGARCAADQDAYWPFQDWAFANQNGENEGAFAATRLTSIASAAGLDITTWKACVAAGTAQTAAKAETAAAVTAGVDATPTMRLNGQTIVGLQSVTDLGAKIEAAAAAAGG